MADYSGGVTPVRSQRVSSPLPTLNIPTKESHSQMFAYAYGQIEKERAFGFKDPSPDVDQSDEVLFRKKRFEIELAFEELSLVLKGSGKKILSNVTGKLSPGRITAIMGPSGAGKTTFLNGLAGKSTNSRTTGEVLINGKPGSIYSYTRIIGFVPQDDIVHGSLTVEENLWFSASYRLPVHMPMYERVLVVERIIQALGLGGIRDSLVGTVENRGISGGQHKRVNVGLELVVEPSLLILDEPTSGLDSTLGMRESLIRYLKDARLAILSATLLLANIFPKVAGELAPDAATSKGFQAGNSRKSLSSDLVVASVGVGVTVVGVAVAVFECWRRNRSSSAVSAPVGDLLPLSRAPLYEA